MFSTMPRTGTLTFLNIASPRPRIDQGKVLRGRNNDRTFNGTFCASVSCASPVPGGMSTTRISRVPHATSRSIWVMADITIGPRQINRGILFDQKTDRHDRKTEPHNRNHFLVVVELRLLANAGQSRYRWPVNVGVEQTDAQTEITQAQRQIERRRRLADTALAGGHRNHRGNPWNFRLFSTSATPDFAAADATRRAAPPLGVPVRRR